MNNITLSLFDFLNFEVIGYLMLRICNIVPKNDGDWLFYVIAYIVGLVVVKLNEKTPWSECMRNNRCFISKGNKSLRELKSKKDADNTRKYQYYKKYYHVLGDRVGNNISILEAQYAFVWNLLVVLIVCSIEYLVNVNDDGKVCIQSLFHAEKNLFPLYHLIFALFVICLVWSFIRKKFVKNACCWRELCCMVLGTGKVLCVTFAIVVFCFSSMGSGCSKPIGYLLSALLVIIPFIAFSIQSKISELIIENDYFFTEMENDKNIETNG